MVYGAIHQSNGYVRISSELNKGTIISFYMPLVNRRVEQPGVQESQVSYNYKTKTVLLVEDDPMVADVTALTLQELGFCVLRADRAQVALEMLESGDHRIDLLLTDVMMEGGMSGVELARQVAHKNKHLKILLMSGFPDEIIRQGDSENSEFQLLPKPFTRTELLLMLENILSDI